MAEKTSIKKQFEEPEFQLPMNPLAPEEREYMRRKRQKSIAVYKKYFANAKTVYSDENTSDYTQRPRKKWKNRKCLTKKMKASLIP